MTLLSTELRAGSEGSGPAVAYYSAQLQVILHHTDDAGALAPLVALHEAAVGRLGGDHPVALLIECAVEEARSRNRAPACSLAAWADLLRRAESILAWDDTTLMSIRAFHIQYRRLGPGDAGPELYRTEWWLRRQALGEDDYRTRIARANIAFALQERASGTDLDEAYELLVDEIAHRVAKYGHDDLFTWKARGLLALVYLDFAERDGNQAAAEQAAALASGLVAVRITRYGRFHVLTYRALVLQVQALLACGQTAEANDQLRYLRRGAARCGAALDVTVRELIERMAVGDAR